MDETLILFKLDKLVDSGSVLYDENQAIVQHVDGGLEMSFGMFEKAGLVLNESIFSFNSCLFRYL